MKLVVDIGGTNVRAALAECSEHGVTLHAIEESQIAQMNSLAHWLGAYASEQGAAGLTECALAVAGPVQSQGSDTVVNMTNFALEIRASELSESLGLPTSIVNDFTALSRGIPHLDAQDVRHIGGGPDAPGFAIGVLGPGTGLGVSGLIPTGNGFAVIAGEGGHVSLPAGCGPGEQQVIELLRAEYGFVGCEDVLCGSYLHRLFAAVCRAHGQADEAAEPCAEEIATRAFERDDPAALETIRLFTLWLGRCAGDLALTLGARSGIYLAGGILPRWGERFDTTVFRQGFCDKGSFRAYVEPIPCYLVTHPYPALLGLASGA